MAVLSMQSFQASVDALATKALAASRSFDSTSSTQTLASAAEAFAAVVSDAQDRLTELNTVDVEGTLTAPRDFLQAAMWERDTRQQLAFLTRDAFNALRALRQQLAGGAARIRSHVVRSGDTLQSIAASELGDWRMWVDIADANGLDPGATLPNGTKLVLPEPRRQREPT